MGNPVKPAINSHHMGNSARLKVISAKTMCNILQLIGLVLYNKHCYPALSLVFRCLNGYACAYFFNVYNSSFYCLPWLALPLSLWRIIYNKLLMFWKSSPNHAIVYEGLVMPALRRGCYRISAGATKTLDWNYRALTMWCYRCLHALSFRKLTV